ncbi:BAH and coiled-coil domain-containing protein 1 [Protopterus annectens]|uniref:BAH and coiled-coil domain-containing protein 1 n=1 Tax=Protopterus annectens TaxID=7888 RepID=UPI001CFB33F8|nr:BAH and coiled-coil domain-containing protein 1 [Protopterus annectens]
MLLVLLFSIFIWILSHTHSDDCLSLDNEQRSRCSKEGTCRTQDPILAVPKDYRLDLYLFSIFLGFTGVHSMDGREFAPPPHLLPDRSSLAHRSAARITSATHSSVQHSGHFQPGKYFPPPIPMAPQAGSGLMGNSSPSFMGSFLASSLGSASTHPAGSTSSPSEPTFRSPHSGTSQIWFPHSHEATGYPRFSGSLASTFLPISHLDHHGNNSVLYGQHRFYETQKDNFYLRSLPSQSTLLSANHNFPSIARAAPGHPIGSCSRDREASLLQKNIKESEKFLASKESSREKTGKADHKDRHAEEEMKERHKVVHPMTAEMQCIEEIHQRSPCENKTKHLNSCLMNSKIVNGEANKTLLSSCTGGVLPRHSSNVGQSRCAKDAARSERDYIHNSSGQLQSECLDNRQMLHHCVSYSVPSSLPNIPPPLNTTPGTFPCLQFHSNTDLLCSAQDKATRELKITGPTLVPSVGYIGDKSRPFQVSVESCRGERSDVRERVHEKYTEQTSSYGTPNIYSHLKQDGRGDRGSEWSLNLSTRYKSMECLGSASSDLLSSTAHQVAKGSSGKGSTYEISQSQDCSRSSQEILCGKINQSCCTLDKVCKDSQVLNSQRVARIRHQQHRPPEGEQTGSCLDSKRKSTELSSLGYTGPQLPPWTVQGQGPPLSVCEERKGPCLDPFSTSLQQAALVPQGSVLSQEIQTPSDEVSAMKNLLKYSNQALIGGQKAPSVSLGNSKASCAHQEMKYHNGKGPQELDRPDCAKSKENESSLGDGEVRQPPVGIAVAVARQKDTRPELPYGANSNRQGRVHPGLKGSRSLYCTTGSSRSMHVIDLEAEEERNRLCEERLGLAGRELLLRENKDIVEFARIHPSSGCPGDLASHLMVGGSSSLQSSQLSTDPTTHAHPAHPHWLPRTGSPSLWMSGHSYGIGHSAVHQSLPPGFSTTMASAVQPVFPLSQDPSAQLVILPTEPPPSHSTPHPLADVMDQASLWPPMYPPRGPASHIQHPGQLPVYSRSQFLRQQELYALQQQQQRAAQALELQRHSQLQRKSEEHQAEFEEPTSDRTVKLSNKAVAFNSSKSLPSTAVLSPSACIAKLSPCYHSPAVRQSSKCSTPQPATPCTLPICPSASPVVTPKSPALSPVPSHSSKRKESEEKRVEGQPPQDFPKSLEPDLPPGYTYPAAGMGYKAPSPDVMHSADPADPETLQAISSAAEPEQSRTFSPLEKADCEAQSSGTLEEEAKEDEETKEEEEEAVLSRNYFVGSSETSQVESPSSHLLTTEKQFLESTYPQQQELDSLTERIDEHISDLIENKEDDLECLRHSDFAQGDITENGTVEERKQEEDVILRTQSSEILNSEVLENSQELSSNSLGFDGKSEAEKDHLMSIDENDRVMFNTSETNSGSNWVWDNTNSLDMLISASIHLGDLPFSHQATVCSSLAHIIPVSSTFGPSSGIHGIALLSELAELDHQQHRREQNSEAEEEANLHLDLQNLATVAAALSLIEAASQTVAPPTDTTAAKPRIRIQRKYNWTSKTKPVCPLKAAVDWIDTQEVEMRMKLADLQRLYKEKQRELAKLQRRHDHERDKHSRSLARRGPGRPRKRKYISSGLSSLRQINQLRKHDSKKAQNRPKKAGFTFLRNELQNDGQPKKKKPRVSEEDYGSSELKARCRNNSSQNKLVSKLAKKVSQLKEKVKDKPVPSNISPFRRKLENKSKKTEKRLGGGKCSDTMLKHLLDSDIQDMMHSKSTPAIVDPASKTDSSTQEALSGSKLMLTQNKTGKKVVSSPKKASDFEEQRKVSRVKGQRAEGRKLKKEVLSEKELSSPKSDSTEQEEFTTTNTEKEGKHLAGHGAHSDINVDKNERLPLVKKNGVKVNETKKKLKGFKVKAKVHQKLQSDLASPLPTDSLFLHDIAHHTAKELREKVSNNRMKSVNRRSKVLQSAFKKRSGTLSLGLSTRSSKAILTKGKKLCKLKNKLTLKQSKGRAVSKLLESFAAEDDFDDDSSFSEDEEDSITASFAIEGARAHVQSCSVRKEDLTDGLRILIPKEDNLLYAAYVKTLQPPDIYGVVIEGERGNRQRIYSLEQLLQEAVHDVRPQSPKDLPTGTRVCAYWSSKSRCLYPGTVLKGSSSDDDKSADSVFVEFDDGDTGRIVLSNIRCLPKDYQIQCTEPSPALLISSENRRARKLSQESTIPKETTTDLCSDEKPSLEHNKSSGKKASSKIKHDKAEDSCSDDKILTAGDRFLERHTNTVLSWSNASQSKKKNTSKNTTAVQNLFQLNGNAKKIKVKEAKEAMFPMQNAPVFSNSFRVDSFSSIASTYRTFGSSCSLMQPQKSVKAKKDKIIPSFSKGLKKKAGNEFLIKLDHEGVMSPKTKNGKALLLSGKDFGLKVNSSLRSLGYSHPALITKDKKGRPGLQNLPVSLGIEKYGSQAEYGLNCDSDCHSSYSDMDEDEVNEDNLRGNVSSSFMSRLSVSSSSSGSSTSSTSGSVSTSSLCSSENEDSSYSSDEEDSTLLLQTCLTHPVPALLAQTEALRTKNNVPQRCFIAKAMAVANKAKLKRKESLSLSKAKEMTKRQRLPSVENRPKISAFLPARQLWKWSGNPTQRRGMKGKARKLFYKAVIRGKEILRIGDCAVFLSAGRPNLPYIGRIESLWESWGSNMVVKVKWFYHPEETKLGERHNDGKNALYQSSHEDENDVQTISHKCQVVSKEQYELMTQNRKHQDNQDLYYLAGTYDPTTGRLLRADGVSIIC